MSRIRFCNNFVKITAWPAQALVFRTKVYYQDKKIQSRRIKGPAIIISNHTSVFDYACYLFVFFGRTLRVQEAEVVMNKKGLGTFLRALGGIRVDRNLFNFSFVGESQKILEQGGVVGIFPESRIPRPGEARPLPFVPSAAYLALKAGVPVIPVYTNGEYFTSKRARVLIGRPMDVEELLKQESLKREASGKTDSEAKEPAAKKAEAGENGRPVSGAELSEQEKIQAVTEAFRSRIMELGNLLDEQCGSKYEKK